jgi:hypothetical protein
MSNQQILQLSFATDVTADELAAAAQARVEAIDRAALHADDEWKVHATAAVLWCAAHLADFTADDVWIQLRRTSPAVTTHEPSALGPIFLAASRQRVITKTTATRPSRFKRRHRDLTVWTGTRSEEA